MQKIKKTWNKKLNKDGWLFKTWFSSLKAEFPYKSQKNFPRKTIKVKSLSNELKLYHKTEILQIHYTKNITKSTLNMNYE